MRTASPLRYPGGKAVLANVLAQTRSLNGLGDLVLAEPFAGGAGASLPLLYGEEVPAIWINDADQAIHDFWWAVTERSSAILNLLRDTPVTIDEWLRQRSVYRRGTASRVRRGFAAFYLNRCNRSGIIIDGGPIGGIKQSGAWKIDARFNKKGLESRLARVAEYRERISVSGTDGMELIRRAEHENAFLSVDPSYYYKGEELYLNSVDTTYHEALAAQMRLLKSPWILTYDDCPETRRIYRGWANIRGFSLRYAAAERRVDAEILISPKWLMLPATQTSAAIGW